MQVSYKSKYIYDFFLQKFKVMHLVLWTTPIITMNNHIISTKKNVVKIEEIDEINTKHLSFSYLKKLGDYKCEFCQKYFKGKDGLHNHVDKIHGTRFEVLSARGGVEIKPKLEIKEKEQKISLIKDPIKSSATNNKLDLVTSMKLEIIQLKKRNKDLENENSQAITKIDKLTSEKILQDKRITKVTNILKILKDKIAEVESTSKQEIKNLKQENEYLIKMKDMFIEEANDSTEKYLIKYKECETLESQQNTLMDILDISISDDRKFSFLQEKLENLMHRINSVKETNNQQDSIQASNEKSSAENSIQLVKTYDKSVIKVEKLDDENLIQLQATNTEARKNEEMILISKLGIPIKTISVKIDGSNVRNKPTSSVTSTNQDDKASGGESGKEKFKNIICMPKLFTFDPAEFPFRCRLLHCKFGAKLYRELEEHTIENHPTSPLGRSILNSATKKIHKKWEFGHSL